MQGKLQDTIRSNWSSFQQSDGMRQVLQKSHSTASPPVFTEKYNPDLEHKVKKACDKFSESQHIIANEPSLAFFRIQEHVHKSMPKLVEKKQAVEELQAQVKGCSFDVEYAVNAVQGMQKSQSHFLSIQESLKNAMFIRQQLQYEKNRNADTEGSPTRARSSSLSSHSQRRHATVFR